MTFQPLPLLIASLILPQLCVGKGIDKRRDGALVTYVSECSNGGQVHSGVVVIEVDDERVHRPDIAYLPQQPGSSAANACFWIVEGSDEVFYRSFVDRFH